MAINPVYLYRANGFKSSVNFKSKEKNNDEINYENPISRKTERNLAILKASGSGALVGIIAGFLTKCFTKTMKAPIITGIAAALATIGLMLPSSLYNTKVNAYAREKEMDVFSRQKSAQSNIYEDINDEINDENVSLDQKINHYSTVRMADNGSGVMVKGV
ncbi:hypothetical protein IJD34_06500 [bacterium]|nr:hypothetical protein [bacterium]